MKTPNIIESSIVCLFRSLAVMLALFVMVMDSCALELTIINHSFENPGLREGEVSASTPGWDREGIVMIYNPDNSFFFGTADGSPNNPLDGLNAVGINNGGRMIYQSTILLSSDNLYAVRFLAGSRRSVPFGNSSVSLWAGTNLLAETFPNPTEGAFVQSMLTYTSPPAGPGIGAPLRIELKAAGAESQAWFDDLHLFANTFVCTPHKATAIAQLINGIFVGGTITDPGCGYTNVPLVTIEGGGGMGATAIAIVTNGSVVVLRVTNGGCCYTNPPKIVILSPPFVPTVGIRVSKVIVTQNVVVGREYVLESSFDFLSWTRTGPNFTATSEVVESEFDITLTGRFFRVREVL